MPERRFRFTCPTCEEVFKSSPGENFEIFANYIFALHTWNHLNLDAKQVIRQTHTPPSAYSQYKPHR